MHLQRRRDEQSAKLQRRQPADLFRITRYTMAVSHVYDSEARGTDNGRCTWCAISRCGKIHRFFRPATVLTGPSPSSPPPLSHSRNGFHHRVPEFTFTCHSPVIHPRRSAWRSVSRNRGKEKKRDRDRGSGEGDGVLSAFSQIFAVSRTRRNLPKETSL